jgi:hypothetical protein
VVDLEQGSDFIGKGVVRKIKTEDRHSRCSCRDVATSRPRSPHRSAGRRGFGRALRIGNEFGLETPEERVGVVVVEKPSVDPEKETPKQAVAARAAEFW